MKRKEEDKNLKWMLPIFGIFALCGIILINLDIMIGGFILIIIAFVFLITFIVSLLKRRKIKEYD